MAESSISPRDALVVVADAEVGRAVRREIEAEGWPGRALDPVLHVDERRFYHYTHPGPGLIRFTLANGAWIEEAVSLSLSYDCPQGCADEAELWPLPTPERAP